MLLDRGSGQFNDTETVQQGIVVTDTAPVTSAPNVFHSQASIL